MKNNILITKRIDRDLNYGKFIYEDDIHLSIYDTENDKDLFEDDDPLFLPNKITSKYIYLLEAYSTSTSYGHLINENNICIKYFDSEEEAITAGIDIIKSGIYRDNLKLGGIEEGELKDNINVLDYEDYTNYNFTVYKILVDRHIFNTYSERNKYYNENLPNIKKEDLYDFLLDCVGGYQITDYTLNGEPYSTSILDSYRDIDTLSLQSLLGYHVNKFNEGDLVKVKEAANKDRIFRILHKYSKYESIYDSNDPLHYREGYQLVFTDNDCILNDWFQDLYYDEELIPTK